MNVIQINLQKTWRGGEQQLAYLIKSFQEKNINQILICKENSALEDFAKIEKINHFAIKSGFRNLFKNLKLLYHLIKENNIDIIHCHESKGHSLALFTKLIYRYKSPIILHRRVIFPIKGILSKKLKYSSKYISEIICVSKAVEKKIKDSTGNNNTIVIPDMIDTQYLYTNHHVLKQKYGISNKKIIGYIAALTPEKDHYTFLDTAKILIQKRKDCHFVLIGDGKDKDELILYSQKIGIEKYVTFTGYIPNAKSIISEIDILLFTSTEEGLGSTILDFFLAKKPVVCVKNGGSEDIVKNFETGFICDKKEVKSLVENIVFILENPEETEKIVQNAYDLVIEKHSIEKISNSILECYKKNLIN